MSIVYLSLGTNLGDKEENLRKAIQLIGERVGNVMSLSAFYETAPWGFASDNSFLNAATGIETTLEPLAVLAEAKAIEKEMGRLQKTENGVYTDRIIDIDLLLYDDLILNTPELTLPHPFMTERAFVMEPLIEIAPDVIHPVLKKSFNVLWEEKKY